MTSKERAAWRAKANGLEAIFQIGKEGISDNLIAQLDDALDVRELIKVRVHLESAPQPPKALAQALDGQTACVVVQQPNFYGGCQCDPGDRRHDRAATPH